MDDFILIDLIYYGDLIMIVKDWCSYCGCCAGVCVRNCIEVKETALVFDDNCNNCGICVDACPLAALEMEEE